MALTIKEKKELNYENLSPELRAKIDAAFSSPHFNTVHALWVQKTALETEMIETPFTIRGVFAPEDIEIDEEGIKDNSTKRMLQEAMTARSNVETVVKVVKWLADAANDIAALQLKLTVVEKNELESIQAGKAEEIRNKVRKEHGLD